MRTVLQLTTTSRLQEFDLDAPEGSLKVIQDAVGGWIEPVFFESTLEMYVNEEGKLNGLDVNPIATRLWESMYGTGTDIIVGDVLFAGGVDDEGETRGLNPDKIAFVRGLVSASDLTSTPALG
jgi:Domain of unknown function (DUF3846)